MTTPREISIPNGVETTCPCGKDVVTGEAADGSPVVVHATPLCENFARWGALKYLRWLNAHKQQARAGAKDSA